eukprot:500811-Prymnesium_polylepis.1
MLSRVNAALITVPITVIGNALPDCPDWGGGILSRRRNGAASCNTQVPRPTSLSKTKSISLISLYYRYAGWTVPHQDKPTHMSPDR